MPPAASRIETKPSVMLSEPWINLELVARAVEKHMHESDPDHVHRRFTDTCPWCLENSLMSKMLSALDLEAVNENIAREYGRGVLREFAQAQEQLLLDEMRSPDA